MPTVTRIYKNSTYPHKAIPRKGMGFQNLSNLVRHGYLTRKASFSSFRLSHGAHGTRPHNVWRYHGIFLDKEGSCLEV